MTDHLPSKELTLRQRLIYCVNGCEFNGMPNTADACREAIAEIDRLRACLTSVQGCATCSVCRGAATLVLGERSGSSVRTICAHAGCTESGIHTHVGDIQAGSSQPPRDDHAG